MANTGTTPRSTIFVLFGATGDLARRLVLPAFYRLAIAGLLPKDWRMIAEVAVRAPDGEFQEEVRKALEEFGPQSVEGPWEEVRHRFLFAGGGFRVPTPEVFSTCWLRPKKDLGEVSS